MQIYFDQNLNFAHKILAVCQSKFVYTLLLNNDVLYLNGKTMKTILPILRKTLSINTLIVVLCLVMYSIGVNATVRYVKPIATGMADGSSWDNASPDIQTMIDISIAQYINLIHSICCLLSGWWSWILSFNRYWYYFCH